ncbi:hypothetical protein EUX98_g1975 [Antrodiella citrinella]|uniref:Uncharacterized protein n=1 Tax=Antrodiella citrinella TaxID=2447956 RepID=A0A4S4N1P0_9APHY|nr:hypothetical protein EUX98_g1975 [Antrodiella citrinella]
MFVRTLSSFFIVVFVLSVTLAKSTGIVVRALLDKLATQLAPPLDKLWENVLGAQETARAVDKQLAP